MSSLYIGESRRYEHQKQTQSKLGMQVLLARIVLVLSRDAQSSAKTSKTNSPNFSPYSMPPTLPAKAPAPVITIPHARVPDPNLQQTFAETLAVTLPAAQPPAKPPEKLLASVTLTFSQALEFPSLQTSETLIAEPMPPMVYAYTPSGFQISGHLGQFIQVRRITRDVCRSSRFGPVMDQTSG